MKYTVSIDVALPRDRVLALFHDPDNLTKWMRRLIRFEMISGQPGQVGSTARFVFKMGKGSMEIVETITQSDLPDVFAGTYEAPGAWNETIHRFLAIDENTTRIESENTFRMRGLMMRLIGFFMPGAFRKQSLQYLQDFKAFAENGTTVPA